MYKFDGSPEHRVRIHPHGNSKSIQPFCRTMISVKTQLARELVTQTPAEAIHKVYSTKGGVIGARSAGELPLHQQQAYNIKNKVKKQRLEGTSSTTCRTRGKGRDLLYIVMEQCKSAERKDRYVQEVTCAPEPMAILAMDQQLIDLERFCCNPSSFSIMGVDPTFNLGEFSVTPTVYQHLLLCHRHTGKSPWMLGPILVHYKKEFRSYNFFFSSLIGLRRGLAAIRAIGTDGELNLIEALKHQFQQAIPLRCFRHLQANIERYLHSHKMPPPTIQKYVEDVFGWTGANGVRHEGLVDSADEDEFYENLELLQETWDHREKNALGEDREPTFFLWFRKNKAADFCTGALKGIRELAGLGSPPTSFYTNPNESMNSALKEKTNYTKMQWPEFNERMKAFVKGQQEEVEKAVVGGGKYELRDEYKFLEVTKDGKWWKMNAGQRENHLKKLHSQALKCLDQPPVTLPTDISRKGKGKKRTEDQMGKERANYQTGQNTGALETMPTILGLSAKDAHSITQLPPSTVSGIWLKASDLASDPETIAKVPGGNTKDRFVLSKSNTQPHHVKGNSNAEYTCDDRCLHYKSISICSHTIAAAHSNGELKELLQWFGERRRGQVTNLFQLAKHGMPLGAGRKGGHPPRRRSKTTSTVATDNTTIPFHHLLSENPVPATQSSTQSAAHTCTSSLPTDHHAVPPTIPAASTGTLLSTSTFVSPPVGSMPAAGRPPSLLSPPSLPLAPPCLPGILGPPSLSTPSTSLRYHLPQMFTPPPMFPSPTAEFNVMFLHGNITICSGCRQRFPRNSAGGYADPPFNMAIQHVEDRQFINPQTGSAQMKRGNAYYHAYLPCLQTKWPQFQPQEFVITTTIKAALTPAHKDLLRRNFGITL